MKKEFSQERLNSRFDLESKNWKDLYKDNISNKLSYNNKLYRQKYVLEMLGEGSGRVLDLGCGAGSYFEYLEKLGFEVVGVDSSKEMIKLASQVAVNLKNSKAVHGDIMDLPFQDQKYDAIIAIGLIEYLPDDISFFEIVKKLLKPGGKAVITFRNKLCLERRLWKLYQKFGLRISKIEYFYREHNPADIIILLNVLGMKNINIRYCHFYPLPWPFSRLLNFINNYFAHKMEKYFSTSSISFLASTFIVSFEKQ
jgi:SAM-dependent methyltransferase